MKVFITVILLIVTSTGGCCRYESERYSTLSIDDSILTLHVDGNWAYVISAEGPFPEDNHSMTIKFQSGVEVKGKVVLEFGKDFVVMGDDRVIGGEITIDKDKKVVVVDLQTKYKIWPNYNSKFELR